MKKVYEAPKMNVEAVCVEELLTASPSEGISIIGEREITDANDEFLLGKDRDDSAWSGLW